MGHKKDACLNQSENERYTSISRAVGVEKQHPAEFGGKVLKRLKGIYSIPLGQGKRILVRRRKVGFSVERVVTHQTYNQIIAKRH